MCLPKKHEPEEEINVNGTCNEKHKRVDEKLDHHESWLQEHEQKLDRLERSDATTTQTIKDLVETTKTQAKIVWGLATIAITGLVGFFFYVVEKGIK